MRKVSDVISKPSQALKAMCDGLEKQSQRRDFKVDMKTFGEVSNGVCFGCAATCTMQELAKVNLVPNTICHRERALGFDMVDCNTFELVMDSARAGSLIALFAYFNIDHKLNPLPFKMWQLSTENWQQQLPIIRKGIVKLESENL